MFAYKETCLMDLLVPSEDLECRRNAGPSALKMEEVRMWSHYLKYISLWSPLSSVEERLRLGW